MRKRPVSHHLRRGMTVLEVTLASSMFAGIGYVLMLSIQANEGSHSTVVATSEKNAEIRETTSKLRDELRAAQSASVVIDESNGQQRLTFQMAIQGAGGAAAWGAFDRRIANDEAACHRENWRLRYEVVLDQEQNAQLVRRVIDDADEVHCEDLLASDVTEFRVAETGDVWLVRLVTESDEGRSEDEFDVRTRIQ